MLSQKTNQLLRKYLEEFVKMEKELENIREQLANNLYFEPYTVFSRLDYKKILHIDVDDIRNFLQDNSILDIDDNYLQLMFRKMDVDKDQYLSFGEFSTYILPHRDQNLNYLAYNRQSYSLQENKLPKQVEKQLIQVFLSEVELNKKMLNSIQSLKAQPDWDNIVVWESVNQGRNWDYKNLQQFLDEFHSLIQLKDIENFIYRNSKDRDYRINYTDFLSLVFAYQDQNKNSKFCTPQKVKNQISGKKSKFLPQTDFRTNESTNIKTDKLHRYQQSQSHHQQLSNNSEIEVSEFKIDENEDQNILKLLLNKLKIQNQIKDQILNQLFHRLDQNNKGFITLDDFIDYFQIELNQPQKIEELIKLVKLLDKNKDGIVSQKEFCEQIFKNICISQF